MSILSLDHHSLKQSELKIFFAMSHLARSYVKFLQQAKSAGLVQARNMSAGHSADGWKMWRNCFLFVGIPVIVLGHVNAFGMSDGSEHEAPPFVPYDHLRIRTKVRI